MIVVGLVLDNIESVIKNNGRFQPPESQTCTYLLWGLKTRAIEITFF